jgi:hypothetical protein
MYNEADGGHFENSLKWTPETFPKLYCKINCTIFILQ